MKKFIIPTVLIFIALVGFIFFHPILPPQTGSESQPHPQINSKSQSSPQVNSKRYLKLEMNSQTNQKPQKQTSTVKNLRYATLVIEGMWCSSCAVSAEYALKEKVGIVDAVVKFGKNSEGLGKVIYNPKQIDLEKIIEAVKPYRAKVVKDEWTTSTNLKNLLK